MRDRVTESFVDLGEDLGVGEQALKNIARPVRAYAVMTGSDAAPHTHRTAGAAKSVPAHLSIVVLPFTNLGGHPEPAALLIA